MQDERRERQKNQFERLKARVPIWDCCRVSGLGLGLPAKLWLPRQLTVPLSNKLKIDVTMHDPSASSSLISFILYPRQNMKRTRRIESGHLNSKLFPMP